MQCKIWYKWYHLKLYWKLKISAIDPKITKQKGIINKPVKYILELWKYSINPN
jgi:hypothetical protein